MASGCYRFDRFTLDPSDRQLRRDGLAVDLNSRYLDALALLVGESGRLVPKQRFMDEVWRGVPVTDEALTQCIRALRQRLGDDAASPRFIETVPKHGYRFISPAEWVEKSGNANSTARAANPWQQALLIAGAGTVGAGIAGLIGGLFYGFAGASQPLAPGMGAISVLLVLVSLSIVAALIGGAGVSLGIALAALASGEQWRWSAAGGALGGLIVGAFGKLIGLDAFTLLLGRTPGDITGAAEGLLLGGGVGLGGWLAARAAGPLRRRTAIAAAASAAGGLLAILVGGRLLGGSLDLLAHRFPTSRLSMDRVGALIGEAGFGPASQLVTGALEGLLFGGGIVGAILLARRHLGEEG